MPLDVEEAVSDQNSGYVENYSFENMFEVVNMTQMQMSSDEDSDSGKTFAQTDPSKLQKVTKCILLKWTL